MVGHVPSKDALYSADSLVAGEIIKAGDLVCRKIGENKVYKYSDAKKDERAILGFAIRSYQGSKTQYDVDDKVSILVRGYIVLAKDNNLTPATRLYFDVADSKLVATRNATTAPQIVGLSARYPGKAEGEVTCWNSGSLTTA